MRRLVAAIPHRYAGSTLSSTGRLHRSTGLIMSNNGGPHRSAGLTMSNTGSPHRSAGRTLSNTGGPHRTAPLILSSPGGACRRAGNEALLVGADRQADNFRWNGQELFLKFAHQHDRPFDEPRNLFEQAFILNEL